MNPDKIYFTSDHHFGHEGIIRFESRPFFDAIDMDWMMIQKWNATVPKDGVVFHLGDFSMHNNKDTIDILDQLNGRIHLVLGNHDRYNRFVKDKFVWVKDYYYLKVDDPNGKQKISLSHYPFTSWRNSGHGSWHLHGHCHGNLTLQIGKSMDVGVDCHKLAPISYWDVKKIMSDKSILVIDHHKEIK